MRKLVIVSICLLTSSVAYAALGAAVWEVRGGRGSDTNGGGFCINNSTGTDYSQQDDPHVIFDGASITASNGGASPTITLSGYSVAADTGNIVNILGGTGFLTGRYEIKSVDTAGNAWTLDRNCTSGTGSGMTGRMGGAMQTSSSTISSMTGGDIVWVASAAYTVAAAIQINKGQVNANPTWFRGYGTVRGDKGRPRIRPSGTGYYLMYLNAAGIIVENFELDCENAGTCSGLQLDNNAYQMIRNLKIHNFATRGMYTSGGWHNIFNTEVYNGQSGCTNAMDMNNSVCKVEGNYVHDNACTGIVGGLGGNYPVFMYNIVANNTGASSHCIKTDHNAVIENNICYKNGGNGIHMTNYKIMFAHSWHNNIFANNGGYGLYLASTPGLPADESFDGNAYYANTSGMRANADDGVLTNVNAVDRTAPYRNPYDIVLTVNPFIDADHGDFRLNNLPGGGAALRNHGYQRTIWPTLTTSGYPDMGTLQYRETIRTGVTIQ